MGLKCFVQNEQTHKQNPVCAQHRKGLKKALAQDCEWGGLCYILIPPSLTTGTLLHNTIFPTRRSLPGVCAVRSCTRHLPCKGLEDWFLSFPGLLRRVLVLGPSASSILQAWVSETFQSETLCLVCSFAFLQGGN